MVFGDGRWTIFLVDIWLDGEVITEIEPPELSTS